MQNKIKYEAENKKNINKKEWKTPSLHILATTKTESKPGAAGDGGTPFAGSAVS